MNRGTPSIACIGIIGRHDNPLHITLLPSATTPSSLTLIHRTPLDFEFLLSTSLDIFYARLPQKTSSPDFGLLQAIDERLAMYGYITNTGVKFVIVVDMEGKQQTLPGGEGGNAVDEQKQRVDRSNALLGIRDADLRPAFRAVHRAYVGLLRNPFYEPDEHDPKSHVGRTKVGGLEIQSPKFDREIRRIAEVWYPGVAMI